MKFKKIIPMALMSLMCLSSCGKEPVYGTYSFRLGREGDDQVRVGIAMKLTDEKVSVSEFDDEKGESYAKQYEKFTIKLDAESMLGKIIEKLDKSLAGLIDDEKDREKIIENLVKMLADEIPGYFDVYDENGDADLVYDSDAKKTLLGYKMAIGFKFEELFEKYFKEQYDAIIGPLPQETKDLISGIIDRFVREIVREIAVCYVKDDSVTLRLPVSLNDLQLQLAWYGTYVDFDPNIKAKIRSISDIKDYIFPLLMSAKVYQLEKLPGTEKSTLYGDPGDLVGEKRFGSHPVAQYSHVERMNAQYAGYFSNSIVYAKQIDSDTGLPYKGSKIGSLYGTEYIDGGKVGISYNFCKLDDSYDFSGAFDCYINTFDPTAGNFSDEKLYSVELTEYQGKFIPLIKEKNPTTGDVSPTPVVISESTLIQTPFEFRDFHDIKIALAKE